MKQDKNKQKEKLPHSTQNKATIKITAIIKQKKEDEI